MFIYFWDRDRAWTREGQRQRETRNPKQAPGSERSAQSLTRSSNPQTARSWPEPKSDAQPSEPPRRPRTFLFLMFIYFWEGECCLGRGRERRGQTIPSGSALRAAIPTQGSNSRIELTSQTRELWDHDLGWSWMLHRLSHPGAPRRSSVKPLLMAEGHPRGRQTFRWTGSTRFLGVCHRCTYSFALWIKADLGLRVRYFVRLIHICFLHLQMLASSLYRREGWKL